jgi:hypothetical protein
MKAMPTIIIMSKPTAGREGKVTLREEVQPAHLASDHHAAQLTERVGWAVADAKEAEDSGASPVIA